MKDSDIKRYTRPMVLLPDTLEQRTPHFKGKSYMPPCQISEEAFNILSNGMASASLGARFEFTKIPAYDIYNNFIFKRKRNKFWRPILKLGYPIYIVSPLFGLVWPGDKAGIYDITIDETFMVWKRLRLDLVAKELYIRNKCDGVLSYLPITYENLVRFQKKDWYTICPEEFPQHMHIFLENARKQ